jgi:hypothetical protein
VWGEEEEEKVFGFESFELEIEFRVGKIEVGKHEQHGNVSKFELTQRVFIFRNTFN